MTNVLSANFSYFEEGGRKITLAELALIKVIENGTWIKGGFFDSENVDKLGIHHLFKSIRNSNKMFYEKRGLSKGEIGDFVQQENEVVIDLLIKCMLPLIRYRLQNDKEFGDVLLKANLRKIPVDSDDSVEIINMYLLERVQKQLRTSSTPGIWTSDFVSSFMIFLRNVQTYIEDKTRRKFDFKVGFVNRVLQIMFPLEKDDVFVFNIEAVPDYVRRLIGDCQIADLVWGYLNTYMEVTDKTHLLSSVDLNKVVPTIGNEVIAKSSIIRRPTNGFSPITSIKIYTLEGCPACIDAKELIAKKGFRSTEVTVTKENQNEIFLKIDAETNKQRGFPIIFINEKYIGGLDSLEKRFTKVNGFSPIPKPPKRKEVENHADVGPTKKQEIENCAICFEPLIGDEQHFKKYQIDGQLEDTCIHGIGIHCKCAATWFEIQEQVKGIQPNCPMCRENVDVFFDCNNNIDLRARYNERGLEEEEDEEEELRRFLGIRNDEEATAFIQELMEGGEEEEDEDYVF